MSNLFMDSFSHYITADITKKWTLNTSCSINTTGGVRGQGALSIPRSNASVRKVFAQQLSTIFLGFRYKFVTLPTSTQFAQFASFMDGSTAQVVFAISTSGKIEARRGTGTVLGTGNVTLQPNSNYYIEMSSTFSNTGSVTVRVNGVVDLNLTNVDTTNTANNFADTVRIGEAGDGTPDALVCDLYINDGSGAAPNNGFLGDIRVDAFFPTADGTNKTFVPDSGTTNFSRVNETAQNGDTSFVSSSTPGDKDTYIFGQITHNPQTIFGVQAIITAKKDDAGARGIIPVTRSGGTDFDGASQALSNGSYISFYETRSVNPATSTPWTQASFNSAEFGYKVE